jgi:hypothetical protein
MLQGKVGSKCGLYCPFITFVFPAHRPVIGFSAPTGSSSGFWRRANVPGGDRAPLCLCPRQGTNQKGRARPHFRDQNSWSVGRSQSHNALDLLKPLVGIGGVIRWSLVRVKPACLGVSW